MPGRPYPQLLLMKLNVGLLPPSTPYSQYFAFLRLGSDSSKEK
jgi:hypothetical protein